MKSYVILIFLALSISAGTFAQTTTTTEASKWSSDIIKSVKADMNKIMTANDAEWLIKTYFNEMISEFYLPTKGKIIAGEYGMNAREYTEDDLLLVLKNAREMKKIIINLNAKFGVDAYTQRIEQIDDMIKKLEYESSYAGQKEKLALDKMLNK